MKTKLYEAQQNRTHMIWGILGCLRITDTPEEHITYNDGLVQDCSNSSAIAMELLLSCTDQSTCTNTFFHRINCTRFFVESTPFSSGRKNIPGAPFEVSMFTCLFIVSPEGYVEKQQKWQKYAFGANKRLWKSVLFIFSRFLLLNSLSSTLAATAQLARGWIISLMICKIFALNTITVEPHECHGVSNHPQLERLFFSAARLG